MRLYEGAEGRGDRRVSRGTHGHSLHEFTGSFQDQFESPPSILEKKVCANQVVGA